MAAEEKLTPTRVGVQPPRDPILVVEDNEETQALLKGILKKMQIPCVVAGNGREGLERVGQGAFSLYIVDLMMPVMDGKQFIKELKKRDPNAVVLVQTGLDLSETIISVMRLGVYDYLIKPIDPEVFQAIVWKAVEYKHLKDLEEGQRASASLKIRSQIEWLNYKESRRVADRDYSSTKSIYSLKTSMSQGAGIGTLVTLIELLKSAAEPQGDKYLVDKNIVDIIIENNDFCRLMIEGLQMVSDIIENEVPLSRAASTDLLEALPGMIEGVLPYMEARRIGVTYPEPRAACPLDLNMEKVALAVEELMINAYKYSVPGSVINIIARQSEGYFWLSVKNEVSEKPYCGIPENYEKMVLEPFFRILPPDESIAKYEKFGSGLGLTVVDNIVRKHKGLFMIRDIRDLTGRAPKLCVMAEMLFPVADAASAAERG